MSRAVGSDGLDREPSELLMAADAPGLHVVRLGPDQRVAVRLLESLEEARVFHRAVRPGQLISSNGHIQ